MGYFALNFTLLTNENIPIPIRIQKGTSAQQSIFITI